MILKHKLLAITLIFSILYSINIEAQALTAMTFNIRYDNSNDGLDRWEIRKDELAQFILEKNPSVVGIQEGLHHQVIFLDSMLQSYRHIGVGRDDGRMAGEYCAIYFDTTKLNLVESGTFWLSTTPDTISIGWDAALPRICTYGHFKENISGKEFFVFNTHFDHQGKSARIEASRLVLKMMQQLNQDNLPMILMGDFNDTPESLTITTLSNQFQDCWLSDSSNIDKSPITFNGFNPTPKNEKRIDYIFSNGFNLHYCTILTQTRKNGRVLSDHFAVYCSIDF